MKHIAFNLDNGYARHIGTVMVSVMENNTSGPVTFHCVCMDVRPEEKEKLSSLASRYGSRVEYYDTDLRSLPEFPKLKEHDYVSLATYLRLFMAELLPRSVEKVLYLDGDIIVRKDLSGLWDTDLEGYAVAGCNDIYGVRMDNRLGFEERYGYFNAGILLANLRYWRETEASRRFRDIIAEYGERLFLRDQDVLNIAFHDRKKEFDFTWNSFGYAPFKYPDLSEWRKDPAIVHYAGSGKPWLYHPDKIFIKEYRRYARMTPWGLYKASVKEVRRAVGRTVTIGYVLGLGTQFDRYRTNRNRRRAAKKR